MSDKKSTPAKKKLKKFYIALYIEHPWESNKQYEIEAESQSEAERVASLLSAINTCEAGVSSIPEFYAMTKIIYCRTKLDENTIRIIY